MKRNILWILVLALGLGLALGAAGCAKKTIPSGGELSAEDRARLERERRLREAQLAEQDARSGETRLRELFVNQDVHFEYDRYDLTAEAKQILNEKARYLQTHPSLNVIVEGNCDERGSNAYNMALGEKRSRAAAAYLEAMGISGARLETVSYGEERPLVLGQTEEAYAANRRAHFVIK